MLRSSSKFRFNVFFISISIFKQARRLIFGIQLDFNITRTNIKREKNGIMFSIKVILSDFINLSNLYNMYDAPNTPIPNTQYVYVPPIKTMMCTIPSISLIICPHHQLKFVGILCDFFVQLNFTLHHLPTYLPTYPPTQSFKALPDGLGR